MLTTTKSTAARFGCLPRNWIIATESAWSRRDSDQRQAGTYGAAFDFYAHFADKHDVSCVLVDEAQFLSVDQVKQLHRVAHVLGIPVICYGIRSDFRGDPFPGSVFLLTLADSLEELKTICACGRKATMNPRVDERGNRVTIGEQIGIEGEHRYLPMCGECFYRTPPAS